MADRYFPQYFRTKRPYYNNAFVAAVYEAARNPRVPVVKLVRDTILHSAGQAGLGPDAHAQLFLSRESPITQTLVTLAWNDTPLYDISPALLEALAHSDTGDMRLADLRSPNHIYYLHWGPQGDLLLHGLNPVEGAIVVTLGDQWHVALVGRSPAPWLSIAQRDSFLLKFPEASRSLRFDQAVDLAIDAERQEILELFAACQSGQSDWGMTPDIRDQLADELQSNAPTLKRALALAGNCMAYLTAYPDDARFDWEADAPARMLAKLHHGDKEARRTASRMKSLGYLQIHRVGLDFQQSMDEAAHASDRAGTAGEGTGPARRPHWRRGHWRHQAWGPQHAQRKLMWMKPVRVLGGPAMSGP
ncbi:hypothetical protein QTI66_34765 [Variovorax sp. J22R133]|uniref:hypothetical protein n=1 Tax=Variovorax brevis TaxID=3053503 RepID=UPI0025760868|nr:hypothetical protein [Variovorax sp. J22R133]MDM0117283.1 hypothetical protein [Variovorax sp. J22R133]